jgi:hypothetical protein
MIVTATNLNSSMLEKITYDRDNDSLYGELSVLFKTGSTYYYEEVHVDDFSKLINSTGTTAGKQYKAIIEQKYMYYDKSYKGVFGNE